MDKKTLVNTIISYIINLGVYMILGGYLGKFAVDKDFSLINMMFLFLCVFLIYFVVIILHEFGHLVFGLISGYKFSSFRVLSIDFVNVKGKIELKKFTLAGTAGQCIMIPPKKDDIPFVLYNLGGIIFNLVLAIIGLIILMFVKNEYVYILLLSFVIINVATFLANGIPLQTIVPNDMQNIIEFSKNKTSFKNFINSLYMQDDIVNGVRPKDLSSKYIHRHEKIDTIGKANDQVVYCAKLMDEHKFSEEIEEINRVIDNKSLINIYKALLLEDMKFCYMVLDKNLEEINNKFDKDMKSILKQMNDYPSVLRTEYAQALLVDKDEEKANKYLEKFNQLDKTFPNLGDYLAEKELIRFVQDKRNSN